VGGALGRGGTDVEIGGRWARDEHGVDRAEQSALTEAAQNPAELPGRDELLGGFQEQDGPVDHGWVGREPSGGEDPLQNLPLVVCPGAGRVRDFVFRGTSTSPQSASGSATLLDGSRDRF